jgi:hypothetical protein
MTTTHTRTRSHAVPLRFPTDPPAVVHPPDLRDAVAALLPPLEAGNVERRQTGWIVSTVNPFTGSVTLQYLIFGQPARFSERLTRIHERLDSYRPALRHAGLHTAGPTDAQPWMVVEAAPC